MEINLVETKKVFEKYEDLIKPSECYDNIWRLFPYIEEEDVLFCYVQHPMIYSMYVHHCVLIKGSSVIDPTFYLWWKNNNRFSIDNLEVIPIKRLSKKQYIDTIIKKSENGGSSTELHFNIEKEIEKLMMKNNKFVLKH